VATTSSVIIGEGDFGTIGWTTTVGCFRSSLPARVPIALLVVFANVWLSSFTSPRCRWSMYVPSNLYRPISVSLSWARFRFTSAKTAHSFTSRLSYNTPPPPPLPQPHRMGYRVAFYTIRSSSFYERHFMFIHSTLLYLSLDGVIPEAFYLCISHIILVAQLSFPAPHGGLREKS
jgi:hypothetical protein